MEDFKRALEDSGLIDMGWKNQKITWSNCHSDETYTLERLDRLVATRRWVEVFGNTGIEVLMAGSSDHCPVLFTVTNSIPYRQRKKIFRYEAKWALEEDGEQVVYSAWQHIGSGRNCWEQMQSKLIKCSKVLMKWSAKKKSIPS